MLINDEKVSFLMLVVCLQITFEARVILSPIEQRTVVDRVCVAAE